jgi:hypothetical protein
MPCLRRTNISRRFRSVPVEAHIELRSSPACRRSSARSEDVDLYLAATKLYFAALAGRNVIVDLTLRRTRANQFGLLGFGGDGSGYSYVPEASAGVFVTDSVLFGAEYRDKPNNLHAFREDSAQDVFVAWGPLKNVSLTAAWTDLGRIAGKSPQSGVYVSLWLGI